jgi:hypothetical protein
LGINQKSAISKINKSGVLLVFPNNNRRDPRSLWFEFFPRTPMRWEWNESGDDRVSQMWMLMKKLSANPAVVYSKWYQSRATFFSREVFTAMLSLLRGQSTLTADLEPSARDILDVLESDSPLSTKEIKRATDLQGKFNEATYNRGMKQLFSRLLIVGFGEVDDGAFPSLAVGATKLIYEDLWTQASRQSAADALATLNRYLPPQSLVRKHFEKISKSLPPPSEVDEEDHAHFSDSDLYELE